MRSLYGNKSLSNSDLLKNAIKKGLKVAYLDIETSPYLVWTYGIFKTTISPTQIEQDTMITSAVLLYEDNKVPIVMNWNPNIKDKDKQLLKDLMKHIRDAEVIIMQNGDKFDAPIIQDRLFKVGLEPLKNIITLDTLLWSKRSFKRASHSLNYRSKVCNLGGKIRQDMSDCIDVAKGNDTKQKQRTKYNIKDVLDTRTIFWKELDYYSLPASALNILSKYQDAIPICIKCAAKRQKRYDISQTPQYNICRSCGYKWSRCK